MGTERMGRAGSALMIRAHRAGRGLRAGRVVGRFDIIFLFRWGVNDVAYRGFELAGKFFVATGFRRAGMIRAHRAGRGLRAGRVVGRFDHYLSFPFSSYLQLSNARRTDFV